MTKISCYLLCWFSVSILICLFQIFVVRLGKLVLGIVWTMGLIVFSEMTLTWLLDVWIDLLSIIFFET